MIDEKRLEIIRSGTAEGLVLFYNLIFSDKGWTLPPHLIPIAKALMDERIRNLQIIIGPGAGKSVLISIIYPLYKLALNPDEAILGISAGESLITSFIQTVMEIIEHSPVFRIMFPNVRPDKGMGWSLERGMFVTGRKVGNSNPSYWGSGIASKALVGKHGTLVVLDDIHDDENSRTVGGREGVLRVYRNTIIGRSDPRGTRFVISGRRWHPDDIYGTLEKEGNFVVMTLPAERPNSELLYWDVTIPDGLVCCFNEGTSNAA